MTRLIPVLEFFFIIFCGVLILTLDVQAQPYPNRPIQMIIGQVPGAAGDITCRPLAEELGKILGVPVIVINKPGGSGTLGVDVVVKSKKDGYTIAYTRIRQGLYMHVLPARKRFLTTLSRTLNLWAFTCSLL